MIFNLIKHAKELLFDNSKSGLSATNVQDAIDEVNRWKWIGDFYGTDGLSVLDYKDTAKEFKLVCVFDGGTGADIAFENHIINTAALSESVYLTSFYYDANYNGCAAHLYDYSNGIINLYPSWSKFTGYTANTLKTRVFFR